MVATDSRIQKLYVLISVKVYTHWFCQNAKIAFNFKSAPMMFI